MKVRFAFLCDYAQESGNGKISALGIGIDNFFVENPAKPVQPFCLVVNFEGGRNEAGPKCLEIQILDAESRSIAAPVRGNLMFQPPAQSNKIGTGIVIYYNGVVFPGYGNYILSVLVDGMEMTTLSISISKPPAHDQLM